MMSVYYLLEEDYSVYKIGEILDVNKDEVKIFGFQRKTSIRIENAKVIPLNSKEANFYVKFDKHKRLVAYKNKLLDKCSQLTEGAKADVTVNYQRHRVIIKEITNENMTLICETEKGKSIKFDVPDISDIVIGESREMGLVVRESRDSLNGRYTRASMEEGYYILCEQIKEFRPGMIIRVEKSGIRTYPDNESIKDIDELIDKVDKIEKYEADALKNSSFATRVKGHRAYSQIKIGGQCYYRVLGKEVLCSIVAKDIQYKGIKLDLLSETKQEHKGVGLSEIRLFDSIPNDASDSLKSLRQIYQNSGRLGSNLYYGTVIIPESIEKIENICFAQWNLGDKVKFMLRDSVEFYKGILKWMGKINEMEACAVEMSNIPETDAINHCKCPNNVLVQLRIQANFCVVLVPMTFVTCEYDVIEIIEKYFTYNLRSANNSVLEQEMLNHIMQTRNSKLLASVIMNMDPPINLELHKNLFPFLIQENNFDLIKLILKNCKILPESFNVTFLNIAKISLERNDENLFELSINKCTNKNCLLENGETFLTNLFKENLSEQIIIKVIDKKVFDLSRKNINDESSLSLACQRLMTATVEAILGKQSLFPNERKSALNLACEAVKNLKELNRSYEDMVQICFLMNNAETISLKECAICMDRSVNVSFECGHASCDICSSELVRCHICQMTIKIKRKLYL